MREPWILPVVLMGTVFTLGAGVDGRYKPRAMTRESIEASVKIFLFALVIAFIITVTKVMAMIGWI